MTVRIEIVLTSPEWDSFNNIRPFQGEALSFWRRVAEVRNLDPKSILSLNDKFTALPTGHEHHWCYPLALKCKRKPSATAER